MRGKFFGGALAAGLAALALPAGAAAGVHAKVTTYPVGDGTSFPAQIAAGDFDADGIVDLVDAGISTGGADWSVLFGEGLGAFAPALTEAAPPRPEGVAVADFDGDGASDFVVPADGSAGGVTVLLSNGDGTFTAQPFIALPGQANAVATGDYNGDGDADIAVSVLQSVFVITGAGNGTFNAPLGPFATGSGAGIGRMASGDFDGNGRDDVVVSPSTPAGQSSTIGTMLSNADGTLNPPVATAVTTTPVDPRVGDFNEDGRSDVVVTFAFANAASVMLAAADGSLGAPVNLATPGTGTAAVGDADHDGHEDIVVAGGSPNAISLFRGAGDGSFGPRIAIPTSIGATTALAADVNGDGFADLELGGGGGVGARGVVAVAVNAPSAQPSPASLGFATTAVGATSPAQTVSVSNDGLPPLHISGIALGGADAGDFRVLTNSCAGRTLAAGASCSVTAAMAPGAGGTRTGALAVQSDSAEGTLSVPLAGTGLAPPPVTKPVDHTAPTVRIVVARQHLRTVIRRGLRATVGCSEACTADVRLTLARTDARRLHLPSRTPLLVAHRTVRLKQAGWTTATLRLRRRAARALRSARRATFTLRIAARDAAGNARIASRTVRVGR